MHQWAAVHNQMTMITGMKHKTSEQHIELGRSKNIKGFRDLLKISNWFEQFNPFSQQQTKLYSLSTGYTAEEYDEINCYDDELMGYNIQKNLDCKSVEEAKVSRNKQVRKLQSLKKGIIAESRTVYIDPLILFNRLTILIERTEKIADYFQYELIPLPTSLFKDSFMRKSKKSSLATYLTRFSNRNNKRKRKVNKGFHTWSAKRLYMENLECSEEENEESDEAEIENNEETQEGLQHLKETGSIFGIDGGALLHRVVWNTAGSYGEILLQHK